MAALGASATILRGAGGAVAPGRDLNLSPDPVSSEFSHQNRQAGQPDSHSDGHATINTDITSPNILIIMADQFRQPLWLNSSDYLTYIRQVIPNIYGLSQVSFTFPQMYCNAAPCAPSRGCFVTGLYPQQHCMFANPSDLADSPNLELNSGYPTYAHFLECANPAYTNNSYYFGKWHLSDGKLESVNDPLAAYGFHSVQYPGTSRPSPNGWPNEGSSGGVYKGSITEPYNGFDFASDSEIVGDFTSWIAGNPVGPWCATVSLVNPHDISYFPDWFFAETYAIRAAQTKRDASYVYRGDKSNYFSSYPYPWNSEDVALPQNNKPSLQAVFAQEVSNNEGAITSIPPRTWLDFLNYYYSLQHEVDSRVGEILAALTPEVRANTIVVFTSDHGEYAGSHGLRTKGGAAYDEALRIPLYVNYPAQTVTQTVYQMCSAVDFPRLIAELGHRGAYNWQNTPYPYLANRESIISYYRQNLPEQKRLVTLNGVTFPYILHTYDNLQADAVAPMSPTYAQLGTTKTHIVCLRTKSDLQYNNGYNGAKYAGYYTWAKCSTYPVSEADADVDHEYYNYGSLRNRSELGNDYFSTNTTAQALASAMKTALGTFTPASGLIGSELLSIPASLTSTYNAAHAAFLTYISNGTC